MALSGQLPCPPHHILLFPLVMHPSTNQPDFTCARGDPSAGLVCGARSNYTCEDIVFAPITSSSGNTPTIISPNNPIIYSLIASSRLLLHLPRMDCCGYRTGGARLAGVYSSASPLATVVQTYAWVPNGPIPGPNNTTLWGPCTNLSSMPASK